MKYIVAVLEVSFKLWVVLFFFAGCAIGIILGPAIGGAIAGFDMFTDFLKKIKP